MDGLRAGAARDFEDVLAAQIAVGSGSGADAHGLVRHLHMQRTRVGFRVHRHGTDTHLLQGADDAAGNRAAVGYQYFIEHGSP